MGLFDDLMKTGLSGLSGAAGQQQGGLAGGILEMLSGGQSGGLAGGLGGLVQMFGQKGLGDIANSWVSTGPNLPISPDQLQNVLGSDMVRGLAAKAGIAPEMAGTVLAQVLPMIVDKLTPNGKIPDAGSSLLEQGMDLLRGKLF